MAVVLSAQATDVGVNRATRELFEIVRTPQQMVKLGEDALIKHIRTIGLYRTNKNIISLSEKLIEEHGSEVPDSRSTLVGLPGVGERLLMLS